ncbi:MAG: hypothetical protein AAB728_05105 [Patescibacteria group bacterium]
MEPAPEPSPDADKPTLEFGPSSPGPHPSSHHHIRRGPLTIGAVILRGGNEEERLAMVSTMEELVASHRSELELLFADPRLGRPYIPHLCIDTASSHERCTFVDGLGEAFRGHLKAEMYTGLRRELVSRSLVKQAQGQDVREPLFAAIRALAAQAREALRSGP